MSDLFGEIGTGRETRARVCRVAYTLNNTQPVRSTIIGDQPLFYMDFDGESLEESEGGVFLNVHELGAFESEIENLRREIDSYDRLAEEFAENPDQKYVDFLSDRALVTQPGVAHKSDESDILSVLNKSRAARAYLEFAAEHGVNIRSSLQVQDAQYERKAGLILINPVLDFDDRLLLAARELRRHWQHRQGALINPLLFHPDNAIVINRVQAADLTVSMIRIAWELQLCGERGAWERVENAPFNDVGRAYAREAFLDFRTINNGQASAAALEAWFLSERCRHEDRKLIKQMLADYKGYVFDREEAQKSLTPALISALGAMPYGKNYLAPHTSTILSDPVFTEVRDRSNANFLWFIKFERTFRETERELQAHPEPAAGGLRSPGKNRNRENFYENEPSTAEIIRIFDTGPDNEKPVDKNGKEGKILPPKSSAERRRSKGKKSKSAQIVYLRRWSGE